MNTILVATDFSANGNKAVIYAANMALSLDCELIILNVYQIPVGMEMGQPIPTEVFDELERDSENNLQALDEEIKKKLNNKLRVAKLAECGFASDEIISKAAENKAGLIIIGTHGQSGIEKLFGTVTTAILRKSNIPVIVVPADTDFKPVEKVVIATHQMEKISEAAKELIGLLVTAFHPKFYVADVLYDKVLQYAEEADQHAALEFLHPEIIKEENVNIPIGIKNVVNETGADMLIMFPERHSFMYRLLYVENTKRVAISTDIPLLAIPGI